MILNGILVGVLVTKLTDYDKSVDLESFLVRSVRL